MYHKSRKKTTYEKKNASGCMRIPRESEDITLKKNSESDTINQIVMAVGRK